MNRREALRVQQRGVRDACFHPAMVEVLLYANHACIGVLSLGKARSFGYLRACRDSQRSIVCQTTHVVVRLRIYTTRITKTERSALTKLAGKSNTANPASVGPILSRHSPSRCEESNHSHTSQVHSQQSPPSYAEGWSGGGARRQTIGRGTTLSIHHTMPSRSSCSRACLQRWRLASDCMVSSLPHDLFHALCSLTTLPTLGSKNSKCYRGWPVLPMSTRRYLWRHLQKTAAHMRSKTYRE